MARFPVATLARFRNKGRLCRTGCLSPAECHLVEEVLAGSFLDELPERLIGDKAYDSDKLDERLKEQYGIEMIAPNRRNRGKTQDRRKLRRYKKRLVRKRVASWHNVP
jgi:hypothetical protein